MLVRSYRWTTRWRTDRFGAVADKGRERWQCGDLGHKKRRSDGCSKRSRDCSISIALRKKTLATPKGHEWLRAAIAMVVATTVMPGATINRK
ncbi:hypothetical protein BHE74_00043623 [Ensete ventricosum]|nr:hypothetical protein BHE74_00043623 [Ensete ventricosum]